MEKAPGIYNVDNLVEITGSVFETKTLIDGEWVTGRPLGLFSLPHRIKCAWMVFTGKADVLIWPRGQ